MCSSSLNQTVLEQSENVLWTLELAGALSLNEGEDVSLVRYTQEGDSNDNGGNL